MIGRVWMSARPSSVQAHSTSCGVRRRGRPRRGPPTRCRGRRGRAAHPRRHPGGRRMPARRAVDDEAGRHRGAAHQAVGQPAHRLDDDVPFAGDGVHAERDASGARRRPCAGRSPPAPSPPLTGPGPGLRGRHTWRTTRAGASGIRDTPPPGTPLRRRRSARTRVVRQTTSRGRPRRRATTARLPGRRGGGTRARSRRQAAPAAPRRRRQRRGTRAS